MKKLVTVNYSANVEIEIPDEIKDETIFEVDVSRQGNPDVEKLVVEILKGALNNVTWRGGEIVEIQEAE